METENGWHYKDVLNAIILTEAKPPYIQDFAIAIRDNGINRKAIAPVLQKYGSDNISYFKEDVLDLLLSYLYIILDDHAISGEEFRDFGLLKILFKVQEWEFYNKRFHQMAEIMFDHLLYIRHDGAISTEESFMTADLQTMFGLTSEQYFEIQKRFAAKHANY